MHWKRLIKRSALAALAGFLSLVLILAGFFALRGLVYRSQSRLLRVGTYAESTTGILRVYYPGWACGSDPPGHALIELSGDFAGAPFLPLPGDGIRLIEQQRDRGWNAEIGEFLECSGRFKQTLGLFLWELSSEELLGREATGRFFEADSCHAITPTPEQHGLIHQLLYPDSLEDGPDEDEEAGN